MTDRHAIAEAWRRLGHQLAELRKAAGYSQYRFAPLTHYSRSTIANIEIGRQHAPQNFWQRCDDVLGAGGTLIRGYEQLQALIRQRHEQVAHALHQESEEHTSSGDREVPFDPMRRRTLVTWGVATATAGGLGLTSVGAVGAGDIGRLQRTETRLHRLGHQHGGESLWQSAVASVDEGYLMLEQSSYGPSVGDQLLRATSGLQLCAGFLAFDARQHHAARACYTGALELARQLSDPEVETRALCGLARVSYTLNRPREGQRLATVAEQVAASHSGSPRLVALSHLRHAAASSLMADAQGADLAITQARKALDRDRDEQVQEWSAFLTPFEIDATEAACALDLGQPSRAEALLEQVIAAYESSRFRRNCALNRARVARARLDSGAVDGAANAANAVIDDLSGELASWWVSNELDAVARRLAHHPDVFGVDRFLARHGAMST